MDNIINGNKSYGYDSLENQKNYGALNNASKVEHRPNVEKETELTGAGKIKTQYLELAVGEKEKMLEKMGLKLTDDGRVVAKPNYDDEKTDTEKTEVEKEEEEKEENSMGEECETCASRKYQDGSDEMVSFKNAQHISPEAATSAVRAHEGEHVSNAYDKAMMEDGKVMMAAVSIHTSICPECGRTYVSGGTTTTMIKYNNDGYGSNAKSQDALVVPGKDIDAVV